MGFTFSPVAPIKVLEELWHYDPVAFGNYHLLLAHHTVEHPTRFHNLFLEADDWFSTRGLPFTVIMDNSLVECGGAVDIKMVMEAAMIINSSIRGKVIAVLPDAMGNGEETRRLIDAEFDSWKWNAEANQLDLMMVLQGANNPDFIASLEYAKTLDCEWVGVPRVLVKTLGSRKGPTALACRVLKQKVHLLGFSDDQNDDYLCSRYGGVSGIDSAVPIRYDGVWSLDAVIPPRDPDWMENGRMSVQNYNNVKAARAVFENGLTTATGRI